MTLVTWTGGMAHRARKATPDGDIKLFLRQNRASPAMANSGRGIDAACSSAGSRQSAKW